MGNEVISAIEKLVKESASITAGGEMSVCRLEG